MAGKWQNYDYRAVTAGTLISIIATIVLLSAPARWVTCRRDHAACVLEDVAVVSRKSQTIPLASIERASRECVRAGKEPECKWSVRLVARGHEGRVFDGIEEAAESERMVHELNAFLRGTGDTVELRRPADRTMGWVLLAVGVVLVVLGIRKNLAEKGY